MQQQRTQRGGRNRRGLAAALRPSVILLTQQANPQKLLDFFNIRFLSNSLLFRPY
jgi:hypothetical protein